MNLPEISIRRPVFAWMLMCAIILFGYISFTRLGLSQLPDVDSPVVSVGLSLPGAAPEVMESQVLDPLEDAIMEIDGIEAVNSTAQQSSGSISVQFSLKRDIDQSMQEIQNKINQVANVLPINLNPPTVRKSNPEDMPILWLVLTSDNADEKPIDMMIYARNFLFNQFSTIPGVGNVAMGGYVDPTVRAWVDINKMRYFNLSAQDIITSIQQEQIEYPAGRIEGKDKEYNLRVVGEARNVNDFSHLMLLNRSGLGANYRTTRLTEVAKVEEGVGDVRRISRFNGKKAVALGILKQHGSNSVEVARLVRERLKEILPVIPANYHVDVRSDNTRFVKQAVDELLFTLLLSALLTSLVCYLFLGSVTSTINVLMSIPTSIIGAFTAFYFFKFTLNTFTLLGLSLAIGIVVDDAIMMLENIVRHQELGKPRRQAALEGATEITFAALAATFAVVAIFLPVVFMEGVIGKYFLQYGVTVTVAVLLSLLEALTLTPMRCSRFLTVQHKPGGLAGLVDRLFGRLAATYTRVLETLLNHRWKTLGVTLAFFAFSIFLSKFIPGEMLPPQDQSAVVVRVKLPVGTALPVTDSRMKELEQFLLKQPEVNGVFSAVGGFGGDAVNQGQVMVSLVDKDKRKLSQADLINRFRTDLKPYLVALHPEFADGKGPGGGPAGPGGGPGGGEGKWGHKGGAEGPRAQQGEHSGWPGKRHEAEGEGHAAGHGRPEGGKPEGGRKWAGAEGHGGKPGEQGGGPGGVHGGGPGGRGGGPGGGRGMNFAGMQVNFQDMSTRGFAAGRGFPIEFIVQGPDWEKLRSLTEDVMQALRDSGVVVDVNTDVQPGMPEIQLTPDREKLAKREVSLRAVTNAINSLVGGQLINKENSYSKAGHRYAIEVRLPWEQRNAQPELEKMVVTNNLGEHIPLGDLVKQEVRPSLTLISRLNRARAITVYGNPAPGHAQQEAMKTVETIVRKMLPPGYSVKMTGSSKGFSDSMHSLYMALLLGILVSYMVLASQFNSFIHPVTVLMALPFSISGAFIGLLVCHQSINIYSMIGFILLMGIVKKNSILLVDFTNQLRAEGADVRSALVRACPVRLRPILMTSIATIAGALPEAISFGPGAETTIPMAIAIIGGVAASTFLTLFVVPCVYSLLSRFEVKDSLPMAPAAVPAEAH
jgi:multidrug efflux pump subunit AcrB